MDQRSDVPATRLEAFVRQHRITPMRLEHASGVTRQHLARIRKAEVDVRCSTIVALVRACRKLLPGKQITALDLFDLDPTED